MNSDLKARRIRAARALCNLDGYTPDDIATGQPAWCGYLPQVDAVLRIMLGEEAWSAIVGIEASSKVTPP